MKSIVLKSPLFIAMLALASFTLTSCEKDEDKPSLKAQIVGDWKITSYTVDGAEYMGSLVTSSKVEFEPYSGTKGDYEWDIFYADGTSDRSSGDYIVDEEDAVIEIEEDGETYDLEVEINNNKLELSGNMEGFRVILKANRD